MVDRPVVASITELQEVWPDLRDVALVELDLRDTQFDWSDARLDRTLLLGCLLPDGESDRVADRGAIVFPPLDLPFRAYRAALYSYDELAAGAEAGTASSLDHRIGSWFATTSRGTSLPAALVHALHDATIDATVARFVIGRRVVGIMGGHAHPPDSDLYRKVAQLGRPLTPAGFTLAPGLGPGVMEAANLGAWLSRFADNVLDQALAVLAAAPPYAEDPDGYVQRALEVRDRWPDAAESLGVPTWVYVDEPTSAFATHIAKYFTNSIREDGLLAIARSGVVYAPGGAGTAEEIFTDTAQNSLTLYEVRSPMVFFGRDFFERAHPELFAAAREQAEMCGWAELVALCDEPDDVLAFIRTHDPDATGRAGIERRREHEDH